MRSPGDDRVGCGMSRRTPAWTTATAIACGCGLACAIALALVLVLASAPAEGAPIAWPDSSASSVSAAPSTSPAVVAATAPAAPEPTSSAPAPAPAPSDAARRAAAITASVDALRKDPLLSGKHKTHTLEWTSDSDDQPAEPVSQSWLQWFAALGRFLSDLSRFLVYGGALVMVALLAVSARHLVQLRNSNRRLRTASAVSHVRDLDVRPESLPEDVGAAAWALWQAGHVKAALSLLYRGALSRLIHRHGVPIQSSSTEGECLQLAKARIAPAAHRYLTQVVRAWEANTYGGRSLSSAMGEALCTGFATRLDAAPPASETPAPDVSATLPGTRA
jgi:hypothetical protein